MNTIFEDYASNSYFPLRPKAWPSFKFERTECLRKLTRLNGGEWSRR